MLRFNIGTHKICYSHDLSLPHNTCKFRQFLVSKHFFLCRRERQGRTSGRARHGRDVGHEGGDGRQSDADRKEDAPTPVAPAQRRPKCEGRAAGHAGDGARSVRHGHGEEAGGNGTGGAAGGRGRRRRRARRRATGDAPALAAPAQGQHHCWTAAKCDHICDHICDHKFVITNL